MDLFGRKAKQAQAYAEAQLYVALAWNAELEQRLDRVEAQSIIREGALDRLRSDNVALIRKCDELARELDRLPQRMSAAPLYKTEEEEELEYALRNGDIDLKEFKELLSQAGLDNTEIELPERPERPIIY